MAVDPSIPLQGIGMNLPGLQAQVQQQQNMAQQYQMGKLQLQQGQQQQRETMALRDVFAQLDANDPTTGLPTPKTIGLISAISPMLGQQFGHQRQLTLASLANMATQNSILQKNQQDLAEKREKDSLKVKSAAVSAYQLVKNQGGDDATAQAAYNKQWMSTSDEMKGAGLLNYLTPEEFQQGRNNPKPYVEALSSVTPPKEVAAQQNVAADNKRADDAAARAERAAKLANQLPVQKAIIALNDEVRAGRPNSQLANAMRAVIANETAPKANTLAATPALTAEQAKLHGDAFLDTLPPGEQQLVKNIAAGKFDINTLSTRDGHREKYAKWATQYKPDWDQQDYGEVKTAVTEFTRGKAGNAVRSFNVALEHIGTLQKLLEALDSGDMRLINEARNIWKTQTGEEAPTNLETAKGVISAEIVKAISGAGGGVTDREEAAKTIAGAASPRQAIGALGVYRELFGGQLIGLERQYKASTRRDDFRDKYLTDTGRAAAEAADHRDVAGSRGGTPAAGPQATPKQGARPEFQEGQTATHPKTGAKVIFRNGAFVPYQARPDAPQAGPAPTPTQPGRATSDPSKMQPTSTPAPGRTLEGEDYQARHQLPPVDVIPLQPPPSVSLRDVKAVGSIAPENEPTMLDKSQNLQPAVIREAARERKRKEEEAKRKKR